jgi:ribonuclease P protein component
VLPKSCRLQRQADFRRVYRRGLAKSCPAFVLYRLNKRAQGLRIGFSVSKKVGNAVVRNRIKRVFRHAVAENLSHFGLGDYVFIIRRPALDSDFVALSRQIRKMAAKLD